MNPETAGKFLGNLIGGRWQEATGTRRVRNVNPANTDQTLYEAADSDPQDVKYAIDAAAAAFPAWSALPAPKRGAILQRASEILARRQEEASLLLAREMGKPIKEARGEVGRSVDLLRYYGGSGWRLAGKYFPSETLGEVIYTMPVPLGVASLITPWNFPSAIPVWKAAPALIAGNTVVLKPARLAPGSAWIIGECLQEAGMPAGVFNIVCGSGEGLSTALVTDRRVRAVSFTGSCGVGGRLYQLCAAPHRRVTLEMGGKNPLLVMADADLDLAVDLAVAGAMWSAGQKCTATSRVIVHEKVLAAFNARLVERVRSLKVGDPLDESNHIGPVVDERQLKGILDLVQAGVAEGARLQVGGQRLEGGAYNKGWYFAPAVFTDVDRKMRIAQEEIFGPVLAVLRARNFEEAMEIANDVAYGLAAAICTRDIATADAFVKRIDAGLVHVNSTTSGAQVHVPFGGMKASSSGFREMGDNGIDFFTTVKTVYHHS